MAYRIVLSLWLFAGVLTTPALAGKADDTLRVLWGTNAPLRTLDFYFDAQRNVQETAVLIWDTLVWRDPADFSYKPLLAKRWLRTDDTTLEFELRDDVVFQDGSKLTAADVVGTINTVADPSFKVAVPDYVNWIAAAVQTGTYRLRIVSKEPFPPALDYLSMLPIYPIEHYAGVGPERMGTHPVGSGPYRAVTVVPGKEYRLERNESYFKGGPKGDRFIKAIDVREVPDAQARVADLLAHHADLIWGIDSERSQSIAQHTGFNVAATETLRIAYLGLDATGRTGVPALQSLQVRQAIAHAVDRQSIVHELIGPPSQVIDAPCSPRMIGCVAEAAHHYDFAPDVARRLLHDSGYEGKVAFDFAVDPALRAVGNAVASDLGKVGITARLQNTSQASLTLLIANPYELSDVSETFGLAFFPGKQDYARDPDLHEWLETAQTTFDPEKRKQLFADAIRRITDQVYWLPLYTLAERYAFTDEVAFVPAVDGLARLYRVQWK